MHEPVAKCISRLTRVLIVTQYDWRSNFRINNLAQGLRNRGHEVAVDAGTVKYRRMRGTPPLA